MKVKNMNDDLSLLDRLFYTTIRLEGIDSNGDEVNGTAFFFDYQVKHRNYLFLVTSCHAVKDMNKCTLKFHYRKEDEPDRDRTVSLTIDTSNDEWHHHPNGIDIAILPVSSIHDSLKAQGVKVFIQSISDKLIPSKKDLDRTIQAIEDVYFIGYPNNIYDKVNYLPVTRKGTTASPLNVDFEGKPWFLLDGAIFPGSSGSPVLIIDQNGYIDRNDVFIPQRRIYFLGILRSAFTYVDRNGLDPRAKKKRIIYKQLMDLGVVIRSDALIETVEDLLQNYEISSTRSKLTRKIRERLGLNLFPLRKHLKNLQS